MFVYLVLELSLILMSVGIGMFFVYFYYGFFVNGNVGDLWVFSGKCLRVGVGDVFFSVGIFGK